jgi:hypothetical protein
MRRYQLFLVPILALAGNAFAGCSGDDNTTTDAGPDVIVKKDATFDVIGQDVPPPVVVTPNGKQLFSSNIIQIFGVTSDNYVIFADNTDGGKLYAADATGTNAAQLIAAPTVSSSATYVAGISGKVVFLWEGISPTATQQVGKLSTWTSSDATLHQVTLKSNAASGFNATTDGSKIIFSANSDTPGSTGDIAGANEDGTGLTTLITGVDIASGNCTPVIGFAGGVNAVTATCASDPGDGGTPVATVTSWTNAWAATSLSVTSALNFWSANSAGDKLLVATPSALSWIAWDGTGSLTQIDAKDIENGGFGYMEKDGNNVLYTTMAGDMYTSPTGTPAPTQLVASGVKYLRSIAPDDSHVIYSTNLDAQQFGSDLYLQSTSSASSATTLVSTLKGALFGLGSLDDFTTDSAYVLWIDNVDTSAFIGDLYYMPIGGGTKAKLTTLEWLNLSGQGSKVVYNDNCQGCGVDSNNQVIGVADIKSVDLSQTTPTPQSLQDGADPQIYMAATKDRVIFTYSQNVPADDGGTLANGNGLYSIAIP